MEKCNGCFRDVPKQEMRARGRFSYCSSGACEDFQWVLYILMLHYFQVCSVLIRRPLCPEFPVPLAMNIPVYNRAARKVIMEKMNSMLIIFINGHKPQNPTLQVIVYAPLINKALILDRIKVVETKTSTEAMVDCLKAFFNYVGFQKSVHYVSDALASSTKTTLAWSHLIPQLMSILEAASCSKFNEASNHK